MYYISLDEVGDFENIKGKRDTEPVFIAGIMFQSDNPDEIGKEKKRIKAYLSAVCAQVGKKYPENLHVSENSSNADVAPVKEYASETLASFFSNDDYPGKDELRENLKNRDGQYYIYVYLKGATDKSSRGKGAFSDLSKDDFAANLYLHMAEDVVTRLLFHNPSMETDNSEFILDLATRKFVYPQGNEKYDRTIANDYATKFEKIGIKPYYGPQVTEKLKNKDAISTEDYDNSRRQSYDLTNKSNYWLSIERESFRSKKNITIPEKGFNVRAISYRNSSATTMGFLYLADLVCSILSYDITTDGGWIKPIDMRLKDLIGNSYQLYVYDEVDTYYNNALLEYEQNDYFEMLSELYAIEESFGESSDYYRETKINQLIESVSKNVDSAKLFSAIARLSDYSYSNQSNKKKLLFIFKGMEKIYNGLIKDSVDDIEFRRYSFKLFDVGTSAYTHEGDSKSAIPFYKKCKDFFDSVSLEKQIVNRNKEVVLLQDLFEFDKGVRLAKKNSELAYNAYLSLKEFGNSESLKRTAGTAISQYGQLAAICEPENAASAFENALSLFTGDEKNYLITLSYYLHFLICMGLKTEYFEKSRLYFGTSDPNKQLKAIIDEASKNSDSFKRFMPEFAFYVYVKALSVFNVAVEQDTLNILMNIDKYLRKAEIRFGNKSHPWELIYKHLALFFINKDRNTTIKYAGLIGEVTWDNDQITAAISHNGQADLYELLGEEEKTSLHINALKECIKNINCEQYSNIDYLGGDELQALRKEIFTYMYD